MCATKRTVACGKGPDGLPVALKVRLCRGPADGRGAPFANGACYDLATNSGDQDSPETISKIFCYSP